MYPSRLRAFALAIASALTLSGPPPPGSPGVAAGASGGVALAEEARTVAAYLASRPTGLTPSEREQLAPVIAEETRRAGLPLPLVLAVIEVESGGDAFARSHAGALGLMQLLPATGETMAARLGVAWHGPKTLFDPMANARLGIGYLAHLIRRYDDLPTALAAYNWGPTRIAERLARGKPLPVRYVRRVLRESERRT